MSPHDAFFNFHTHFCSQDVPDSAATIKGFMVQWSQGSLNWTERKDSGQTQAQVSINLGQYDFTVRALLHSGSAIPAHIIIPQKDIDGEQRGLG